MYYGFVINIVNKEILIHRIKTSDISSINYVFNFEILHDQHVGNSDILHFWF